MSGVDPSVSSTSTLPSSEPDPSVSAMPSGIAPPRVDEAPEELLTTAGLHLESELVAATAESSGFVVLGCDGVAMGAMASSLGWAIALLEMGYDIATVLTEGGRDALLDTALGSDGSPSSRAFGAGVGCQLLHMTSAEIQAVAARFPERDGIRDAFVAGAEHGRRVGTEGVAGWEEAREEYRNIFRAWSDGHAAALGGWDTPGRSDVFERSRAEMSEYLDAHPDEAAVLRQHYRADLREGFMAADAGAIDEHRYELDASYRAGVEHHRRLETGEPGALERGRHDIVGVTASSFTLGSFAA